MRRTVGTVLFLLIWFASAAAIRAQVTTGTISGTVRDRSGAVLPGVKVAILNEDTGISRDATSDAGGRYSATSLSLGNYKVSASLEGFQTQVRSGIVLTVGREALVDIELNVGAVSQTVEVTGEAPLVQTAEAAVGYLVADKTIRDLPLNGRDVTQLILLNPGVFSAVNSKADSEKVGYGKRISISGSRGEDNAYLLDGTYINDYQRHIPAGPSGALLGAETIREFQVLTNSFSAQYGRAMGGVFNAVSKAGANEWHGSAYEYLRNSALDARDFFDVGKLPLRRNQFGGTISGPVKHDRTFFFAAFEAMRESLSRTQINIVPDEAVRRNAVPVVAPFLPFFPLPNGRNFGDGTAQYHFPAPQPTTENFGQGRLDHQISSKDAVFARFTASNSERMRVAYYPGNASTQVLKTRLLTLSETRILSNAALNTFRASFSRVVPISFTTGFAAPAGVITVPGQALPGISPGNNITAYNNNVIPRIFFLTNRFNYADDASWTLGAHAVKFGGTLERFQFNVDQPNRPNGTWAFNSLTDFLAGRPSTYRGTPPLTGAGSERGMRQWFYAWYLQDDWQVKPRLTLNLGLRIDRSSVPTEVNGLIANIHHREDREPTVGGDYWKATGFNVAPRFGFAWSPFGGSKTSVRGGVGMFYMPVDPGVWFRAMARVAPLFAELQFTSPVGFPDALAAIRAASAASFGTVYVFSYDNMRTPHSVQYNLNVQQQIGSSSVLTVGYVGNRGFNLVSLKNYNMPAATYNGRSLEFPANAAKFNPNFECICYYNDDTNSWYNALTVSYQRRFSAGLQAQVSYTYSKTLNENDGNNTAQNVTSNDFSTQKYTYDRSANRGLSGYGVPMAIVANYSYDLPLGKGMKGIAAKALAGWQLSGIVTAQRGQPFSIFAATPTALQNVQVNTVRSPNLNPGYKANPTEGTSAGCRLSTSATGSVNIPAGTPLRTVDHYFDPCAFSAPGPRELGNLGRNTLVGPGLVKWDFSLLKNIPLTERYNLQFRSEYFNLLNHPNFAGPQASEFNGNGFFTASAGNTSSTLNQNWRQIQFALRLTF